MICIRSIEDVNRARLPPQLAAVAAKHIKAIIEAYSTGYQPESDGFLAVVTPSDSDHSIGEQLGRGWSEGMFEGASYDKINNVYLTMILRNNQYGISILIPNEPWLDPAILARMINEIGPQDGG